jgi:RecA/RadA recombinase
MTNDLTSRLLKGSKRAGKLLDKSSINDIEIIDTGVPILNLALSGDLDGGLVSTGGTQLSGPSRHFKSLFGLLLVKAYLDKYEDATMLYYDSEGGATMKYFKSMGIDSDRVIHIEITDIEELKIHLVSMINPTNDNGIKAGDHAIIFIDSIGNLASMKEVEDAEEGNSVADMTRAKALKSFFRIITPKLKLKLKIPLVFVNHVYAQMTAHAPAKIGGGTGPELASDSIFVIGRTQEKETKGKTKDITGYNFTMKLHKSRFVREQATFELQLRYDMGINKYSGLLNNAIAGKFVKEQPDPKDGRKKVYMRVGIDTDSGFPKDSTSTAEFWDVLLANEEFKTYMRELYQLPDSPLLS